MRTRSKVLIGAGGALVLLEIGAATAGITGQHTAARPVPRPAATIYLPGGINNAVRMPSPAMRPRASVMRPPAPASRG